MIMASEYYLKNRKKILEQARLRRLEFPEKRKEQQQRDVERNGEKRRAKQAEWRKENAARISESKKIFFQENKELIYEKRKTQKWAITRQSEYNSEYREKNKDRIKERLRMYLDGNAHHRVKHMLLGRVGGIIKRARATVKDRHVDFLGCSRSAFVAHIESLFKDGMTWDNYGKGGWEIDHIKPCSSFDLTLEDEQLKCFHYTNMQPLWWRENIRKGKKII